MAIEEHRILLKHFLIQKGTEKYKYIQNPMEYSRSSVGKEG